MKYILLFSFFIPIHFFAQDILSPSKDQSLTPDVARTNKIREQKATTLVSRYSSGASSHRDSTLLDTAILEMKQYDVNGNISLKTYSAILDKSNYSTRSAYSYNSKGELICARTYEDDTLIDSMVVTNRLPNYTDYSYHRGYYVIHYREGDSLLIEKRISGKDTIIHKHKLADDAGRTHWDDEYTGYYATKIVKSDAAHHIDTCTFYTKKGKIIITIIDHYDSFNRLVCSDYYNRSDRAFLIYSARYNENYNMGIFMPTDKKGKLTYRILRTYNSQGLLLEIKHIPTKERQGITAIKFDYTYY